MTESPKLHSEVGNLYQQHFCMLKPVCLEMKIYGSVLHDVTLGRNQLLAQKKSLDRSLDDAFHVRTMNG